MRSKYFTFLYNECKRLSAAPVDSQEIKRFIDSPDGERGFKSFCAQQKKPVISTRPKSIGTLLESITHE